MIKAGALIAGQANDVTVRVSNRGSTTVQGAAAGLLLPAGWTTTTPVAEGPLPPSGTIEVHFSVTPSRDAFTADIVAAASGQSDGLLLVAEHRARVNCTSRQTVG